MLIYYSYLSIINVAAFFIYGIDKWKASHRKWRTPEAVLIAAACIGGSAGALLGMYVFHHKTRKPAFRYGILVILILQISIGCVLKYFF